MVVARHDTPAWYIFDNHSEERFLKTTRIIENAEYDEFCPILSTRGTFIAANGILL